MEDKADPIYVDSLDWWNKTKASPELLHDWLQDQYRGEVTAAQRITSFRDKYTQEGTKEYKILSVIASQEETHAEWVKNLLETRGLPVDLSTKESRYWRPTLSVPITFEIGCAIGAHAEEMRLARISVIAADTAAPRDIREVFRKILPQEQFHADAFASFATPESLSATKENHELGRQLLGLSK